MLVSPILVLASIAKDEFTVDDEEAELPVGAIDLRRGGGAMPRDDIEILLTRFAGLCNPRLNRVSPAGGDSWGIMLERLRLFSIRTGPILDRRRLFPGVDPTLETETRRPGVF